PAPLLARRTDPLAATPPRPRAASCSRRPPVRSSGSTPPSPAAGSPSPSPRSPVHRGLVPVRSSSSNPCSPSTLNFRGVAVSLILAERAYRIPGPRDVLLGPPGRSQDLWNDARGIRQLGCTCGESGPLQRL